MSASTYDDPPRRSTSAHAVDSDGELVLYDVATNRTALLDARAALVWQVLDGTVTIAELVSDLSDVFGIDRGVIRADVIALLRQLHHLGFLTPTGESGMTTITGHVLPDPPSP
jgi:hypothetical protein